MADSLNTRLSRRALLAGAMRIGGSLGALAALGPVAACTTSSTEARLGINSGTQPLWRYVAVNRERLLRSLGHSATFTTFESEAAARQAFKDGKIDVVASVGSQVPLIDADGLQAQLFLPIAWFAETLPIIVPARSTIATLQDLAGKRLAGPPADDPFFAYWRAFFLANYNFRVEDRIQVISTIQDAPGALSAGDVDAAIVNSLAWATLKPTGQYRILTDLTTEWKRFSPNSRPLVFGGYVARRSWIGSNGKFVEDLIKATADGITEYRKDKAAFLRTAAQYQNPATGTISADDLGIIASYLGMDVTDTSRVYLTEADAEDGRKVWEQMARAGFLREAPKSPADLFYLSPNRPKG